MTYSLIGGHGDLVLRDVDNACIPADPDNPDWRAYLTWLRSGNVPNTMPGPQALARISDRQFFQALALAGEITQDEALAAVMTGTLPAAMEAIVDTLPADQRFGARMLISGATTFERSHPLCETIRTALGWTSEQLDAFWRTAAGL